MRCIETVLPISLFCSLLHRTDTWDVLKRSKKQKRAIYQMIEPTHEMYWNFSKYVFAPTYPLHRTDTWDVLKLRLANVVRLLFRDRTDTWDVLKPALISPTGTVSSIEPTHEMYWNYLNLSNRLSISEIEPTHEMYWNWSLWRVQTCGGWIEPTHEMYWNIGWFRRYHNHLCIEPTHEMYWNMHSLRALVRKLRNRTDTWDVLKPWKLSETSKREIYRTDTWDVLKQIATHLIDAIVSIEPTHEMYWNILGATMIEELTKSNRHMRCIETRVQMFHLLPPHHRTDTWDVLKHC